MPGKYLVDQYGNPITSENPFPVAATLTGRILAEEKDIAVTANADILTDYTSTNTEKSVLRVMTDTAGVLNLEDDGVLGSLNGGAALDTDKWYAFEITLLKDSVYNLQLSATGTMQIKWIGGV